MATLVARQQLDMMAMRSGSLDPTPTSQVFRIVGGTYRQDFVGSYRVSFVDGERAVTGGTVQSVVLTNLPSSLTNVANITGLGLDAAQVWRLADLKQWDSLHSYMFAGNDVMTGSAYNDVLLGYGGNDSLRGGSGTDRLTGGAGNDTLDGGAGRDTLDGGAGNDRYVVDNASDTIIEGTGGGRDSVVSSVAFTLASNLEDVTLSGTLAVSATGNGLDNSLTGNGAANLLQGLGGNDTLAGGEGNDTLDGGAGTDTASYAAAAAAVKVNLSLSGGQYTRGAGTDTLIGIDNLVGSKFADCLVGNAQANRLDGGAGADTMYGGGGDDTYVVDVAADRVVEYQMAGTDKILSPISWNLMNNPGVENLTLTGTANVNAKGNDPNTAGSGENIIIGNAGDNELSGLSGSDTLSGGEGNDILFGGLGSDTLTGGGGGDRFVFDTAIDDPVTGPNVDTITDFAVCEDTIVLGSVFSALVAEYPDFPDALSEEYFRIVDGLTIDPAADGTLDPNDYIIYDDTTGALYYDLDGSGSGGAPIQFAQLSAGLKIEGFSAADFALA